MTRDGASLRHCSGPHLSPKTPTNSLTFSTIICPVISRVHSFVLQGIDAGPCEIEADLSPSGLPKTLLLCPSEGYSKVVIMDNLSSHKRMKTPAIVESASAPVEHLLPYSADLNPIEMIFK